ncbi:hypothetical protein ACT3SP_04010 [Brachybacterium sp. AOP43-C2-M15]|uniref:hypothetical protein n=1 Tax=Brachybacterium sp. AOP43-C2-M15 TaxID=3457661 RepID=UPI0040349DE2
MTALARSAPESVREPVPVPVPVREPVPVPVREPVPEPVREPEPASTLDGVMAALAWLPRLVGLHLGWVVLVLLGGVLAGLAPATATMLAVLRGEDLRGDQLRGEQRRGEELGGSGTLDGGATSGGASAADGGIRARAAVILRRYRHELVAANAAAGPFVLLAAAAGLNVALGVAGALPAWFFPGGFAASLLLAVLSALALFHALALHCLRPGASAPVLWRGALAGPVLLPIATGSWAITLTATVIVSLLVQPVGLLLAGGILVSVTSLVLVRSWQARLDAALAPTPTSS